MEDHEIEDCLSNIEQYWTEHSYEEYLEQALSQLQSSLQVAES